ncbi:hypothetical protein [Methylobacterium sp. 22177]|uniref:hypothetical protein n=1 Tax=Methylobacterium sp. 22177 TaxID=3453885 RepID=UPI003F86260E
MVSDVVGIENATALPWSTAPAKGEISRLKSIKRQMYGRAGFELLRQRVLNTVEPITRSDGESDFGSG